jgi:hypothetical protein
MVACIFTVILGLIVLALFGGGGLKFAGPWGALAGAPGAVIIILGLFGVGC